MLPNNLDKLFRESGDLLKELEERISKASKAIQDIKPYLEELTERIDNDKA